MSKIFKKYFILLLLMHPAIAYLSMAYLNTSAQAISQALFIILALVYFLGKKDVKFPRYALLVMLFAIYVTIRDIESGFLGDQKGFFTYFAKYNYVVIFLLVLFLENIPYMHKFIKIILKIIPVLIVISFIISLIQVFIDGDFLINPEREGLISSSKYLQRRPSIFGWSTPNTIGMGFMPLCAFYILYLVYQKKKYLYWLVLIGIIAIATNARYVMVSFLMISFIPVFYNVRNKRIKIFRLEYLRYVILILFIGFLAIRVLDYDIKQFYNQRLFAEGKISETTRYKAFYVFADFFPKNPVFGTGERRDEEVREAAGEIASSSQIHVGYLQIWVQFGLVAGLLLFSFWFLFAKKLWKIGKATGFYGGFWAFAIFLFTNLTMPMYNFFYFGMVVALVATFHFMKYDYPIKNKNIK